MSRLSKIAVVPEAERLITTAEAARALGISARTLARYVERRYVTPAVILPSGQYRWRLAELRAEIRALAERGEE